MEILRSLNKNEADRVFNENAILISDRDCITFDTVVELFGQECANFPQEPARDFNFYSIGGGITIKYLSIRGFYKAVTYHNIKQQKGEI